MFDTLLASHPIGTPWNRAVVPALVFHTLLVVAAVSSTATPNASAPPVARDTIRMELAEPAEPLPPKISEPPRSDLDEALPEPPRAPDIRFHVPELQPQPLSFSGLGRPESSPGSLLRLSGESSVSPDSLRAVFSTAEVDELPQLLGGLHPRYPEELGRAGVSGLVQVQYVVGSDGKVDERSVRVVASSHPAFLREALQALRDSRFKPARRGGRPTAVLVQQTIRFSYR